MASRFTIILAIILVGMVVSCGKDKAPPTADPERLSSLPQFDGTETPTNDSSDLTILEIGQAAKNEGLADIETLATMGGRTYQNAQEKGILLQLEQVEPRERELNIIFATHVVVVNRTEADTPEKPHRLDLEVDLLVSGAIALSDPSKKLFSVGIVFDAGESRGQNVNLVCTRAGIGSYSVTVRAESPDDGRYAVTADGVVDCVEPAPLVGKTLNLQTLVIDGRHYPAGQFDNSGRSAADCDQFAFGAFSIPYESSADGKLMSVPGVVFSFEDPQLPSLQPQGVCGYGLISEHYPYIMFKVDLKTFEAFCDRYHAASLQAIPEGGTQQQYIRENFMREGCRRGLRTLRN